MDKLRTTLFNRFEALVLNIGGKRSRWRQWYIKHRDDALGREVVGMDKFGNKYYQYYSFHGLPTRRMVIYKFLNENRFNIDPHFVGWLHRQDVLPPTPEELEKLYLDHDAF
jgi:NADH:ubiquinone oxidoreductase subunit